MDQLRDFADDRLLIGCIYCGERAETRDHVPSRVLLDEPFPENLPVVGACLGCNNGFSQDEEYFACLIEAAIAGSADPRQVRRPAIAGILGRSTALRSRIEAAKTVSSGQTHFAVEPQRIRNVLLKLARGHAAYELSQSCRDEPDYVGWRPLCSMNDEERQSFEAPHFPRILGEVGSRATQRMTVIQVQLSDPEAGTPKPFGFLMNDWVLVQDGRYRYLALDDEDGIWIRMIIGEYLAGEVGWQRS